ncbi:uncharacterized protein M421DRAFT_421869 [Didymella exigua CBS 183.55]|uniref:Rhodopsin domain-containing protein n=1 Tax=Didymella exigua CBS 183.55 TaxID=1150837 RepID=A0A6A5RPP7_9PLEO|nr:uncharacterized protein M421DRAFT_421869 [Didymella exigua CBS 183.55]KAF1927457.1 hypothetical protein M421DRAFT_421869 [Didymella exigua CBS 183.55]
MKTRKKFAVSAVFATGLITCGVSALRLYYSSREDRSNDSTYWLALVGLCGAVEIAMVILCGCFTSVPRFIRWMRDEKTGSQRYGSQQYKRKYGYSSQDQSRSYEYGPESQSRLRHETPNTMELGRTGVTQVRAAHHNWRVLR